MQASAAGRAKMLGVANLRCAKRARTSEMGRREATFRDVGKVSSIPTTVVASGYQACGFHHPTCHFARRRLDNPPPAELKAAQRLVVLATCWPFSSQLKMASPLRTLTIPAASPFKPSSAPIPPQAHTASHRPGLAPIFRIELLIVRLLSGAPSGPYLGFGAICAAWPRAVALARKAFCVVSDPGGSLANALNASINKA